MNFNKHLNFEGAHSFLSASQHSWLNYDDAKLINRYSTVQAAQLGTRIHALAAEHISLKIKMPNDNKTFNQYVNDAIGYRMSPEVVLFYSPNAFGTADSISFRDNFLRIHDLKTGVTRVSMDQLEIYAALFCLEYDIKPNKIGMELRIYQKNDILVNEPEPDRIFHVMDKIVRFDKLIEEMKEADD